MRAMVAADLFLPIWDQIQRAQQRRAQLFPTEADALAAMHQAYQRLADLGWRPVMYMPKDGSLVQLADPGCPVAHAGRWLGSRPFVAEAGDLWPCDAVLFRPLAGGDR